MNKEIIEYRKKHKKCKWCKWHHYHSVPPYIDCDYYEKCILKDKCLSCFEFLQNIKAIFCKYYKVKEDK